MFVRITTPDSKSKLLNIGHIRTLRGSKFIVDTETADVTDYDPELYESQDGEAPEIELTESEVIVVGTLIETENDHEIYAMEPEHVLTAAISKLLPPGFSIAS